MMNTAVQCPRDGRFGSESVTVYHRKCYSAQSSGYLLETVEKWRQARALGGEIETRLKQKGGRDDDKQVRRKSRAKKRREEK